MVKSRFTCTDIAAMVNSLRPELVGSKVVNVYDIGGKLFLIKFSSKADDPGTEDAVVAGRNILLIESGIRFHLTEYERKKSPIPSGWTMNLRKLLRGKSLERIEQVGADRVVIFRFSNSVNVILELYSKGNIVVTDSEYRVQLLLRSFQFDEGGQVAKNEVYPLAEAAKVQDPILPGWSQNEEILTAVRQLNLHAIAQELGRKKSSPAVRSAERILGKIVPFAHTALLQGAMRGFCLSTSGDLCQHVVEFCEGILKLAQKSGQVGFTTPTDFAPFEALLGDNNDIKTPTNFTSFSKAVDAYFSSVELGSDADRAEVQRKALVSRVDKIRADQGRRIDELGSEIENIWTQATVLESNLSVCSTALLILNALLAQQLSWPAVAAAVKAQSAGHPIARHIKQLDLARNKFQLELEEVCVWVDIGLNATGNVAALHTARKALQQKLVRTEEQSKIALKEAETKMHADLSKFDDAAARSRHLAKVRRRFWFEKFHWFITSEGFLVVAGRDASQNEQIFKKYLRKGDAYVHADIHGAASVVVKNIRTEDKEIVSIPPISLAEAGQFSLCHSSAWNSKIVTSAWWVHSEQVSKTAPTGEYLTTGSFMIRGRKNFLPPARLELGIGILFYLSEESAKEHPVERRVRSGQDATEAAQDRNFEDIGDFGDVVATGKTAGKPKQQQPEKVKRNAKKVLLSIEEPVVPAKPPSARTQRMKDKRKGGKDKYQFSDSEDEQIRKQIVGHRRAPEVVVESVGVQRPTEDKPCFRCGEIGHLAAQCPDVSAPRFSAEVEEDSPDLPDDSLNVLSRLAAVVGASEEILHAVPVCGPYAALAYFPLKIKVVPGSTKRGKAAKLCTQILVGMTSDSTQKQLMKLVPVEEFSECLVPEVKLAAAGVSKIQVDNKKAKKAQNKAASKPPSPKDS